MSSVLRFSLTMHLNLQLQDLPLTLPSFASIFEFRGILPGDAFCVSRAPFESPVAYFLELELFFSSGEMSSLCSISMCRASRSSSFTANSPSCCLLSVSPNWLSTSFQTSISIESFLLSTSSLCTARILLFIDISDCCLTIMSNNVNDVHSRSLCIPDTLSLTSPFLSMAPNFGVVTLHTIFMLKRVPHRHYKHAVKVKASAD